MRRTFFIALVMAIISFSATSFCFASEISQTFQLEWHEFEQTKPTMVLRKFRLECMKDIVEIFGGTKKASDALAAIHGGEEYLSREACEDYIAVLSTYISLLGNIADVNNKAQLHLGKTIEIMIMQVYQTRDGFQKLLPIL